MKFRQEFDVPENIATVWGFFDQPVRVAECIPGVEKVDVLDADKLTVRVTQKVGPIGATFESKVHITERVHEERIQFTSTGKAVRGAIGNFRATNTVFLQSVGDQTHIVVEGEAALAGALGSVGHKIIMKQADKVTAEFARNLERVLCGTVPPADASEVKRPATGQAAGSTPPGRPAEAILPAGAGVSAAERWAKISAVLSGAAVVVGLTILWRCGLH